MKVRELLGRLRRRVLLHRRPLAALAAAAAVLLGLQAARPAATARVVVWTAAHDLAGGIVLDTGDLRRTGVPVGTAPAHAPPVGALLGHTLVAPVRAGQQLSDLSVVGRSLVARYPGRAVVPVRVGDAAAAGLLRPGDRVDVVAGDPSGNGTGRLLTAGAVVVTVTARDPSTSPGGPAGRLVLLAVPDVDAVAVSASGLSGYLGVTWSH